MEESVYYYNPLAFLARWSVWVNGRAYGLSVNPNEVEDGLLDLGEMSSTTFRHMCAETGQIRVTPDRVKPEILSQVAAIVGEYRTIPENSSEPELADAEADAEEDWGDADWNAKIEEEEESDPNPEPETDGELELDW